MNKVYIVDIEAVETRYNCSMERTFTKAVI